MCDLSQQAIIARHDRAIRRIMSEHPEWNLDETRFADLFREYNREEYFGELLREALSEEIEERRAML